MSRLPLGPGRWSRSIKPGWEVSPGADILHQCIVSPMCVNRYFDSRRVARFDSSVLTVNQAVKISYIMLCEPDSHAETHFVQEIFMKLTTSTITIASTCVATLLLGTVIFGQQAPPAGAPGGGRGGSGGRGGAPQQPDACGGRSALPQLACPSDIAGMMAALPDKPYVTPASARKILVLGKASGFVHSSIPLASKMVEYLGDRTGAWTTTISYENTVINPENLKQYDAIFLDSTTGAFLDDPNDPSGTEVRRKALLDFVKGGKGLAGIHAATDSYHGRGGGPPVAGAAAAAPAQPQGTWPEFNEMIGGFFKFHWTYPTLISVKIDDPKSPLTQMFSPRGYEVVDETYTFAQDSFSRKRVHVLTSINYDKMSQNDKDKEPAATRRTDGDYALSYIQHVGNGRVFYEAHGHNEQVYFMRPFVAHMLAGIQYALGDLKADDSPSVK